MCSDPCTPDSSQTMRTYNLLGSCGIYISYIHTKFRILETSNTTSNSWAFLIFLNYTKNKWQEIISTCTGKLHNSTIPIIHYYITPQHISIYCMSDHYIIMCKAVLNITVYISLNYPSCKMNTDLEVSPGQKEEVLFIYLPNIRFSCIQVCLNYSLGKFILFVTYYVTYLWPIWPYHIF